ncbi:MAG: hypothetical protein EBW52_03155 [Betaproteobacteria bacterium]|nr:hypothetical protein [Betaproteobacteria bacterium]
MDSALALVARGRTVREVCSVLGVSRSHITTRRSRPSDWVDRRRAPPRPDDTQLLANIKTVVHDLPTYGYRRVWGVLRHQGIEGHEPIIANPKRVYRVMRDHNPVCQHKPEPIDFELMCKSGCSGDVQCQSQPLPWTLWSNRSRI